MYWRVNGPSLDLYLNMSDFIRGQKPPGEYVDLVHCRVTNIRRRRFWAPPWIAAWSFGQLRSRRERRSQSCGSHSPPACRIRGSREIYSCRWISENSPCTQQIGMASELLRGECDPHPTSSCHLQWLVQWNRPSWMLHSTWYRDRADWSTFMHLSAGDICTQMGACKQDIESTHELQSCVNSYPHMLFMMHI